MAIPAKDIIIGSVVITAVAVVGYIGYRTMTAVSKIGTGENVKAAGSAVWNARPRIIFKGVDDGTSALGELEMGRL